MKKSASIWEKRITLRITRRLIAEYDENGTLQRKFVYGVGIDEPVAMLVAGSGWYYYHYDGLGSVIALSDSSGNIVEQCSYDVFGEPSCVSETNPYKFTGRRYDAETGLYYYRARYYNAKIGRFMSPDCVTLHLLAMYANNTVNARYGGVYISAENLREFITKDPSGRWLANTPSGRFLLDCQHGIFLGLNLYGYCGNNPINWDDPFGLGWGKWWKAGLKGLAGLGLNLMGSALALWGASHGNVPFVVAGGGIFLAGVGLEISAYKDLAETVENPPGQELMKNETNQWQEQMDWLDQQENPGKNCPKKSDGP